MLFFLVCFLYFLKKVADIIAPKLSIIFHRLIRLGSFWCIGGLLILLLAVCQWSIPKGAPSPDWQNYRPISITPILSKVYEKIVSHKLSSFCEKYGLLPAAQFAYRKGRGCTDALLTIPHHLQKSLDAGMESYIVQLDFSAAFDKSESQWFLIQIEVYWCRWQCAVDLYRAPLRP